VKIAVYSLAVILAVGALCALRIAVANFRGELSDYRRWPANAVSRHPERTGITGLHEVSFAARDGSKVSGWYAPSRNRAAIVLVHGTGADRSSLLAETRILADAGFGALALDLPGQGASDGHTKWGVPERQAISAALDWLTTQADVDPARMGGFGLSMGAYVLTQAAVLDARLRAVTLAACPNDVVEQNWVSSSQWGLLSQLPTYWALRVSGQTLDMLPKNVIGAIAPRAVFILGGTLDDAVPEYMGRQLYAAAGDPKELWIVSGAAHGNYLQVAPQEYRTRLTEFFRRTLLD
jgi:dipeptidyl aminopeptidase/acylaminoacyl peptidase